jgi:hypothetical protein
VVNIEPPEHWPRCGPTRTHHLDFQTFMYQVHEHKEKAKELAGQDWERAQAASQKKYAESLRPMTGIQLKAEYAAIATRVLGSAQSVNLSKPELLKKCVHLHARELRQPAQRVVATQLRRIADCHQRHKAPATAQPLAQQRRQRDCGEHLVQHLRGHNDRSG